MTIKQFDTLSCGDLVYLVKLGRNTPIATGAAIKINRTHKKIMPFGIDKFYHYSKVKVGINPTGGGIWGSCSKQMIVESLEHDPSYKSIY